MRKNFGSKPWTYPQPVFILAAYDETGAPNAMNARGEASARRMSCLSALARGTRRPRIFWRARPLP